MTGKNTEDSFINEPYIGDFWYSPVERYYEMYLQAANILLRTANERNNLQEVCIPLFFLQRHTLELSMKEILKQLYYLTKMDTEVTWKPSNKMLENLTKEHGLEKLKNDLRKSTQELGMHCSYPQELEDFVAMICQYESDNYNGTWSRYESNRSGQKHIQRPMQLPSNAIQQQLTKIINVFFVKKRNGTYDLFEAGTIEGAINEKLVKYAPTFFY